MIINGVRAGVVSPLFSKWPPWPPSWILRFESSFSHYMKINKFYVTNKSLKIQFLPNKQYQQKKPEVNPPTITMMMDLIGSQIKHVQPTLWPVVT